MGKKQDEAAGRPALRTCSVSKGGHDEVIKRGAYNMMANAKIERRKKNPKTKATSRTSFKPRIVDSSALIEEEKNRRKKNHPAAAWLQSDLPAVRLRQTG